MPRSFSFSFFSSYPISYLDTYIYIYNVALSYVHAVFDRQPGMHTNFTNKSISTRGQIASGRINFRECLFFPWKTFRERIGGSFFLFLLVKKGKCILDFFWTFLFTFFSNILFLWEDFESIFSFLGCWNFSFLFNIIIIIIIYTIKFNLSILHRRNDRCHLLLSSIPNYNHASDVHLILQRIKIFDSRSSNESWKKEKEKIPSLLSHPTVYRSIVKETGYREEESDPRWTRVSRRRKRGHVLI